MRLLLTLLCALSALARQEVVVYTSQDQIYAEAVFAAFTKETGIKVLPLFDSESVKTAGLVQRLIAEKNNPRADVFWSNEEMLASQLVQRSVIDASTWTVGGYRTRRLVVNTNLVALKDAPRNLRELAEAKWFGKIALAYPIYGTTFAHMEALRQKWGDAQWREWCEKLAANKPFVVDGNSLVVRLVGTGEAAIGLTDFDDIAAGQRNKLPITAAALTDEFLIVPSSIGVIKGAPNPSHAKAFHRYAASRAALDVLVQKGALEGAAIPQNGLRLELPAQVDETRAVLKEVFARK